VMVHYDNGVVTSMEMSLNLRLFRIPPVGVGQP